MPTNLLHARLPVLPAYDAKGFDIKMSKELSMTTQEQAYASPICYTPGN